MLGFSAIGQFSLTEYGTAARGKSDLVKIILHSKHDENIGLVAAHIETIVLHGKHDENIALNANHNETINLHGRHRETEGLDS